jgi:hypothetical protein
MLKIPTLIFETGCNIFKNLTQGERALIEELLESRKSI